MFFIVHLLMLVLMFLVSLRYGYGLMDATAMVELAEKWTNVPNQHICEQPSDVREM